MDITYNQLAAIYSSAQIIGSKSRRHSLLTLFLQQIVCTDER